jgi:dGTPase
MRAPFATRADRTRGRLVPESESANRTPFQRDRDRIIHATAFRRLQYKTQVFIYHEGDHYRTRLTHSLEVAQIARSLSRSLGLDEDLAEALALAHDLGHTPFGHAGERALQDGLAAYGGFDHNVQTLRILTRLERRYAAFDGLNLTWETLEGVVKHNGPLRGPYAAGPHAAAGAVPAEAIAAYDARHPLDLDTFPGPEAQVAALADDIAYNSHDVDDGLRAGLFDEADLAGLPLVGPLIGAVRDRWGDLDRPRLAHEVVRRMIDVMITDVLAETRRRIAAAQPASAEAVRGLPAPLVAFSDEMQAHDRALKQFLWTHMYRHWRVNRMTSKARRVVKDLFALFHAEPNTLPDEWRALADAPGTARTARVAADYIAGMTDRFALDEHFRLFDRYSKTR